MRIAALALVAAVLACGPQQDPRRAARHLILVTVDTLRADRLSSYGNPLGLTPHLDALAEEGIVFRHAFAPAPFTLASLSAILTGYYPDALGVRSNRAVVPSSAVTLAEHLRAFGFRTGAVVGNFVARKESGLGQGFERYDDRMGQREGRRLMPERRAPQTTADAIALLDELLESGGRVFLWVHYQDPHGPYTAPSNYDAPPGRPPAGVRDRRLDGSHASDKEVLLRLRTELLQTEAEFAKGPPEILQDLSEHERAQLEALGYIIDEEP